MQEVGVHVAAEARMLAEPETSLLASSPFLWKSLVMYFRTSQDVSSASSDFSVNGIKHNIDLRYKLDVMQNHYVLVLVHFERTVTTKQSFTLSPAWLLCLWFVSSVLLFLSFYS